MRGCLKLYAVTGGTSYKEMSAAAADKSGYRGPSAKLLEQTGAIVGDVLEIETERGERIQGTLVPRYEHDDDRHFVIKLSSGYNIGVSIEKISKVTRLAKGESPKFISTQRTANSSLPVVSILGTGGTIASRVDYRTGAVHPATTSEELYSLFPELSEIANIRPEIVLSVYSENLEPSHWEVMAKKVAEVVASGVSGVILTMGTDTMGYAAAAMSFALLGIPIPLFLVGSQRSSDRPSSDAFLNLIGAATMAVQADLSGVYVVMHADSSDERLAVHSGTRVRKDHTSARDAFESIGIPPIGYWSREGLILDRTAPPRRRDEARSSFSLSSFVPRPTFDPRVALVKFFPAMSMEYLTATLDSGLHGVILEGTGLGHINRKNIAVVKRFIDEKGGLVCMTSQCLWGRVDMRVYDTGRDLLRAGVIPLEDMLPETALVKMMWALANSASSDEAARLMEADLAGETTRRTIPKECSS
jgi:glutamyl-tRNA(Gln) amidotransferase subunit D